MSACGGGGNDEPDCAATQTACSGTCTDTLSDGQNCGTCGNACGTGTACFGGICAATCGDGVKAASEACDDGNKTADDGCSAACAIETGWSCQGAPSTCSTGCGDSIIAGMENCDDGNAASGDGCSAACAVEDGFTCTGAPSDCVTTCGDGIVAGAETCDDSGTTANDGCDASCATETGYTCSGAPSTCATTCGDGVIAGAEVCDDGGSASGDGCDASCAIESGFTCAGAPSACATTCGDGITAGAETCDDSNNQDGDGCSAACAIESGFTCGGAPSDCTTTCGDGITAGAETCDDGGGQEGDGCSSTCQIDSGYTCSGAPSVCATTCGDGVAAGAEQCDDGGTAAGDGCDATCAQETGYVCVGTPSICSPICGDGVMAATESCDDGNPTSGDGCSSACAIEAGFLCSGTPSVCITTCGDGIAAGSEACDDGGTGAGDGCSATCTLEPGYACTGSPSTCAPVCGDGILIGAEGCDDGNTGSSDGCSSTCTVESGFYCSGAPSACSTMCGDGIVAGAESCDSGSAGGTGCSAACTVELGFTCTGSPSTCTPKIACPAGSTLSGFAASGLPKAIDQTKPIALSTITVSSPGVVLKAGVGVSAPHVWVGDLDLSLQGPNNVQIDLSTGNGGSGDNYTDTVFDDDAATAITAASAPFTGSFKPEQPLTPVNGDFAAGTWTLTVEDTYPSGDHGSLTQFELYLCVCTTCETGAACTDNVDNDADGALDCADPDCTGVAGCAVCGNGAVEPGESCDDSGVVAGDGCSATCSVEPGYACTGAPSVCAVRISCPAGSTMAAYAGANLPLTVDNNTPLVYSPATVSGPGLVAKAAVAFSATHVYDGDLDITLQSPGTTEVALSLGRGSSGDDFTGTLFDDAAATAISAGSAPFSGAYRPEQPLSSVLGMAAAGTWNLKVEDTYVSSDHGQVTQYELLLCVCTNCEIGLACGDGVDNDGNGLTDCADAQCNGTAGCAVCGNGAVEPGEACDDGNGNSGDGCSSTCTPETGYQCSGNPSTCTPRLACAAGSTFHVQVSTDVPKPVTNTTPATSIISVTAPGVITSAGVGMSITHTYVSDLNVELDATGASVLLSSGNGGSGDDYLQTWFDDAAGASITTGSAPFSGTYQPEAPLSALNGRFAADTYTLDVTDTYSGDDGTVTDFVLMMCVCTTCETGAACGDTVDNDADGTTDCADSDCSTYPACLP